MPVGVVEVEFVKKTLSDMGRQHDSLRTANTTAPAVVLAMAQPGDTKCLQRLGCQHAVTLSRWRHSARKANPAVIMTGSLVDFGPRTEYDLVIRGLRCVVARVRDGFSVVMVTEGGNRSI